MEPTDSEATPLRVVKLLPQLIRESHGIIERHKLIDLPIRQAERSIGDETAETGGLKVSGPELVKWIGEYDKPVELELVSRKRAKEQSGPNDRMLRDVSGLTENSINLRHVNCAPKDRMKTPGKILLNDERARRRLEIAAAGTELARVRLQKAKERAAKILSADKDDQSTDEESDDRDL